MEEKKLILSTEGTMALLTKSDWVIIGILSLLFILYMLIFGTDALKYLIA